MGHLRVVLGARGDCGFVVSGTGGQPGNCGANTADSDNPRQVLDPLPIPPVAQQTAPGYYEMSFEQGIAQFHPGIPPTHVWGYNDGFLAQSGYLGLSV